MNYIQKVAEFHKLFDMPVKHKPAIPKRDRRVQLRLNLIEEEFNELKKAITDNDFVEVADALCDLQYVLSGAIIEFGLTDKFDELFQAVHDSNMSKACPDRDTAEQTVAYYNKERGVDSYIIRKGSKYLVYRIPDNKALKSVSYKPVDIKTLLET